MTKTINIVFEDKEHEKLKKRKGDLTWKEYITRE
jgi:hypothetical protein